MTLIKFNEITLTIKRELKINQREKEYYLKNIKGYFYAIRLFMG